MTQITFNQVSKPYVTVTQSKRPYWGARNRSILTVPSLPGGLLERSEVDPLVIPVEILIDAEGADDLRRKAEEVAQWLDTEEPAPLIFSNDPKRTYYAVVEGELNPDEMVTYSKVGVSFLCPDPHKYGPSDEADFVNDAVTIENVGTAQTYPTLYMDVLEDLSYVDIVAATGEFMRIGDPGRLDQPQYERRPLLFHDPCTDTAGWTAATDSEVDNGYVRGNILATPDGFVPETFGVAVEPYAWQGPSLKRSVTDQSGQAASMNNFQVDILVELMNVGNGTGMIEVYFRDVNNNTVAKIGIEDVWRGRERVQAKMQLGNLGDPNEFDYYTQADYDYGWNNFNGMIRLYRDDYSGEKRIRPYFAVINPDGTHDWVRSNYYYEDTAEEFQNPVTQIQVAFRKWPAKTEANMKVKGITAWSFEVEQGIPYLARAGDRLLFDMDKRNILLNGESIKNEKAFPASYLSLAPGTNQFYTYPEGALNTKMVWSPAYK